MITKYKASGKEYFDIYDCGHEGSIQGLSKDGLIELMNEIKTVVGIEELDGWFEEMNPAKNDVRDIFDEAQRKFCRNNGYAIDGDHDAFARKDSDN